MRERGDPLVSEGLVLSLNRLWHEDAHLGFEPAFEFLQADDGPDAVHRDTELGTDGADDLRVCGVLLEDVVQVGVVDAGLCDIGQGRQGAEGRVEREGLAYGVRVVSVGA